MTTGTSAVKVTFNGAVKDAFKAARWQFAGAVALLSLLLLASPPTLTLLMWERTAIADGQVWRCLSGHLVHLSATNCLSNLMRLLLIGEYLGDELALAEVCALAVGTAAGISLCLWWFSPQIHWYVGLSGVLHGLWAGCALAWFCRNGDRVAAAALLLLVVKLVLPANSYNPLPVVTVAHGYGALCGLIWAVLRACQRRHGIFG